MDARLNGNRRIEYRKRIVSEIIAQQGRVPSYRELARLMDARGIEISHVQVMKYCKTMTLPPRHEPQTLLLSP